MCKMRKFDLAYIDFDDLMGISTAQPPSQQTFPTTKAFKMNTKDFRGLIIKCPTYAGNVMKAKLKVLSKMNGSRYITINYYGFLSKWSRGTKETRIFLTESESTKSILESHSTTDLIFFEVSMYTKYFKFIYNIS